MKAWIARDGDGEAELFNEDPEWDKSEGDGYWLRCKVGDVNAIASSLGLQKGHKQPIELTAAPLGPSVQGGES